MKYRNGGDFGMQALVWHFGAEICLFVWVFFLKKNI